MTRCSGEGVVDGEAVIVVPSSERFLVNDAGALMDDIGKLLLVGNGDDGLNGSVSMRLFEIQDQAIDEPLDWVSNT